MADYTKLRAELEEQLHHLQARAVEIDRDLTVERDDDWEERATELEGEEVLSSVGQATLKEISQIKHALHMIDKGEYGTCERCGGEIPKARLEAVPYATTCIKC